ncbi:MAG: DUF4143 domain-containing protein [Hahellaceae bacterium]|nr:DUF4143 domain-containing protein [Hahellaceae bacterium]
MPNRCTDIAIYQPMSSSLDVRQMLLIRDMLLFDKFVRLCAGRIGQLFVASQLANEVGVSIHTIQHWLSVLEASFIIHRLPPFHENIGKRLVKAFKLYFVDVGLAAWLLGIETASQIQRDPLRGALFENLVVMELIKARANQGQDPQLFFYRDSNGNEVDALFKRGRRYTPIEIKSAATFHQRFLKGLEAFRRAYPEGAELGFLIYDGAMSPSRSGRRLLAVQIGRGIFQPDQSDARPWSMICFSSSAKGYCRLIIQ